MQTSPDNLIENAQMAVQAGHPHRAMTGFQCLW